MSGDCGDDDDDQLAPLLIFPRGIFWGVALTRAVGNSKSMKGSSSSN